MVNACYPTLLLCEVVAYCSMDICVCVYVFTICMYVSNSFLDSYFWYNFMEVICAVLYNEGEGKGALC